MLMAHLEAGCAKAADAFRSERCRAAQPTKRLLIRPFHVGHASTATSGRAWRLLNLSFAFDPQMSAKRQRRAACMSSENRMADIISSAGTGGIGSDAFSRIEKINGLWPTSAWVSLRS
jgi:hypothetical protein